MRMLTLLFCVLLPVSLRAKEPVEFRPLFNGKDLDGWVRVNTAESTWKVEDGMLICSGKPVGELRTTKMYQNFILEVEWRHMVPRGNAGIFIWADDITARGVPFHRSIEVQVLENEYGNTQSHTTHGDIFPIHGAKMTPVNGRGGDRAFPTENRSKPSPEWNHYRIECQDGNISLAVNGKVVTQGKECTPRKGYICLESEGGVVHYRNLQIIELPDTPIQPEQVAIADRGYRCLYNGLDLTGWEPSLNWVPADWVLNYSDSEKPGTLTTTEKFSGDLGVILDARLNPKSSPFTLTLRGGSFTIDPAKEPFAQTIGKGGWTRLEAELRGDKVSIRINGEKVQETSLTNLTESGPLKLQAGGPTDFANIYIRPLKAAD